MTILEALISFRNECLTKFNSKLDNNFTPAASGKVLMIDDSGNAVPSEISTTPDYTYGTTDMTPGVSELETGKVYFVYEE